jgi:20S proteasome subunit alpha 6
LLDSAALLEAGSQVPRETIFCNQYDNDVTVWSPQGRSHQIEYAVEAIKPGLATVNVKHQTTTTFSVLVSLTGRSQNLQLTREKFSMLTAILVSPLPGLLQKIDY